MKAASPTTGSIASFTRRPGSGSSPPSPRDPRGSLFGDLRRLCALTDGNLNRHLEVLQGAGLVEIWKRFEGRRPQTLVRLSVEGRQRFLDYLGELEKVLHDARKARALERAEGAPPALKPGWNPA